MNKLTRFALAAVATAGFAYAAPAFADSYTFTLTPANATVNAGGVYTFTGTIAAAAGNANDLSLVGESANGDTGLTVDTDAFYNDTPLVLGSGESYMGDLFTVALSPTITAGTYQGFVSVILDDAAGNQLIESQNFTVNATTAVAATPEPASWALLMTGIAGIGTLRRRFAAAR